MCFISMENNTPYSQIVDAREKLALGIKTRRFGMNKNKSFSSAVQAHRETIQRISSLIASFSDPSKRALVFLGFSLIAISNAK